MFISRRALILLAAVALAFAACDSTATTPTTSTTTTVPSTTIASTTTTTTTAAPAPTVLPPEQEALLTAQIDALIAATEEIRGLPFLERPDVAIVTPEELAVRVAGLVSEQLGDLDVETRWLQLLGLLGVDADLATLVEELYSDQVLGFYDGETRQLVVGTRSAELTTFDEMNLVHELIHALTDQHFQFHDHRMRLLDEKRYDELEAHLALVEGDATYFQLIWIQEMLSLTDQLALATQLLETDMSSLANVPLVLQNDLAFAYEEGFEFVAQLVATGGIAAVDAAYTNPPATTEQVMHPDRYVAGEPARVVGLPDLVLDGYELYERSTSGEQGIRLLFAESLDAGLATQTAAGWGGDQYAIYDDGDDIVYVLLVVGDSEQDAFELAEGFLTLARSGMGAGDGVEDGGGVLFTGDELYVFVDRLDDRLLFVAATDPGAGAQARELAGVVG